MAQSARLEIHEMNVGQGDSILIVNRNLDAVKAAIQNKLLTLPAEPIHYVPFALANNVSLVGTVNQALLIDGGDDEYGGDVEAYLSLQGALEVKPNTAFCPKLSLLVSHYHDDHMAGLRSIFKQRIDPKKKGEKARVVDRYRPAAVYMVAPDTRADPGTVRFASFKTDVNDAALAPSNPTECHYLDPGGFSFGTRTTATIELGTGVNSIPITLHVLAAAQAVYDKKTDKVIAITSVTSKVDQNDRSVVMVLQYGSFRYFVGGDIAGNGGATGGNTTANSVDASTRKYYSTHADVESTLGPALKAYFPKTTTWKANEPKYPCAGYCTVMKANHHGSSSSVDTYLLSTLRPLLLVVSSGIKARFHKHPTQQVIDRASREQTAAWAVKDSTATVDNSIDRIYLTEVAQKVKGTAFGVDLRGRGRIVGDIVVRPVDETIQQVQASTKPGEKLDVQVYGTGAQTALADTQTTLRATEPLNNPASPQGYPIGPWIHSDTH